MPKYVLHYFNARGRAEIARMLFAAAGVEYTDNRYNMEEWLKLKPDVQMGQLPVLDVDGKRLGQSGAINSYLAREFGLYGKDSFHMARIDEISGCLDDIVKLLMKIVFEKDADAKEKLRVEMENGQLKEWMAKFELLLAQYHQDYESTSEVTLAEIAIHNFMDLIMKFFPNVTIPAPMKKCADKVEANENLKKWIESRPQTEM